MLRVSAWSRGEGVDRNDDDCSIVNVLNATELDT